MKISKSAGKLLKPHIPLLVYALLEALTSLEPQYLNYVSLHVASNEDAQNRVRFNRMDNDKYYLHMSFNTQKLYNCHLANSLERLLTCKF